MISVRKLNKFTHFTFRTNCETFCNMIVFGKAESTQTKGTAKSIKSNVHIKISAFKLYDILSTLDTRTFRVIQGSQLLSNKVTEMSRRADSGKAGEKAFIVRAAWGREQPIWAGNKI